MCELSGLGRVQTSWKGGGSVKESSAQRSCRSHSSLYMLCTSEEKDILMLSFQVIILCCFNHLSDPESAEKEWIGKKLTFVLTLALFLFANCKPVLYELCLSGTGVKDGKLNVSLKQTQISWPISVPWCVGLHVWGCQWSGCSQKEMGLSHHSFCQAGAVCRQDFILRHTDLKINFSPSFFFPLLFFPPLLWFSVWQ